MNRKSLSTLSLNISETEYRELPQLSYSTLAKYEKGGFSSIPHLFEKQESDSLTFGSMVDTLITEGEEAFRKKFVVVDFKLPSDALVEITKELLNMPVETLDEISDEDILNTCNAFEYCAKMSDAVRIKKVREGCTSYFNDMKRCGDRIIVSERTYQEVLATVGALKNCSQSAAYLQHSRNETELTCEFLYQQKFIDTIDGLDVKCMFDLILVNHDKKVIIPIDLKTSSAPEYDFPRKYVENRYDIQSRLYSAILRDIISKDEYFADFTVQCFRFLVINKTSLLPLLFKDEKSTEPLGDIKLTFESGYNKILRNPITIGKELKHYLETGQKVPDGIDIFKPIDIYKQLLKNE